MLASVFMHASAKHMQLTVGLVGNRPPHLMPGPGSSPLRLPQDQLCH